MGYEQTAEALERIGAELVAVDPSDKNDVARLGSSLEGLLEQPGTLPPAITPLLDQVLELLRALYGDEVAQPEGACDVVAQGLLASAEHCRDGQSETSASAIAKSSAAVSALLQPAQPASEPQAMVAAVAQTHEDTPVEEHPAPLTAQDDPAPTPAVTQPPPAATPAAPTAAPTAPASTGATQSEAVQTLPADTDLDLMKEFIVECMDHIAAAESSLLDLESNPGDTELINTIFRGFHTIKGTSGFLGLGSIQKLAHRAESLLNRGRDGQIKIRGGYADLALRSCDALRFMVQGLRDLEIGAPLPVAAGLDELLAHLDNPESFGICEDVQVQRMRVGDILVAQDAATREQIEQTVSETSGKKIGQALVDSGVANAQVVAEALRTQKKIDGGDADSTIRVGTARLDNLINMVGELVIAQSMVSQDRLVASATDLSRKVNHASKIVRELQDLSMSLRMVPLRATFQKMARLVRDLGRKSSKSVQLICEGEGTEIDRSMVEVLNDPLVHMIRNSVDHGIESADARAQSGKNPVGTVMLKAYHSAGKVVLELKDDGGGLNKARIMAKAVEKGLVAKDAQLSDSEVFALIFEAGFSTAAKVTDISGRGVGMDVVRKGIESLHGQIDVKSVEGEGATFILRLPLTMAIMDAMLVRVGQERYLLPRVSVERSFQPTAQSISTVSGKGEMIQLRGKLLPLLRLHRLFDVQGAVTDPTKGIVIVLEGQSRRTALLVDELLGQQQVVIKSLGSLLGSGPGVAGGAILGDGRVGLILDASGIVELSYQPKAKAA